ncbi:hypothetical protein GWK47_019999 [Chionoecetes opilio]|uniref:Uncharacterized protein n=1 Tax=Chionoecetes opilio TaxID=41210 RepID=A0A8J4XU30_CHIOP|nr:hypothetical protein GWK47_019999 [Chionoecetes opilio]
MDHPHLALCIFAPLHKVLSSKRFGVGSSFFPTEHWHPVRQERPLTTIGGFLERGTYSLLFSGLPVFLLLVEGKRKSREATSRRLSIFAVLCVMVVAALAMPNPDADADPEASRWGGGHYNPPHSHSHTHHQGHIHHYTHYPGGHTTGHIEYPYRSHYGRPQAPGGTEVWGRYPSLRTHNTRGGGEKTLGSVLTATWNSGRGEPP